VRPAKLDLRAAARSACLKLSAEADIGDVLGAAAIAATAHHGEENGSLEAIAEAAFATRSPSRSLAMWSWPMRATRLGAA
jgi:hypothetical protein